MMKLLLLAALGRAAALADVLRGHAPAHGVLAAGDTQAATALSGGKDEVAAAHLALARAEAALELSSQVLPGEGAAPRFSAAAGRASGAGAVAVVGGHGGGAALGDPVSAISLTLKSLAFVMNQASAHMEAQTLLKKETGDKYVGKIAAALAVDGDKLSAAYQALLADVGTRMSDSVRDVAEAVMFNLCADNALAVASSIKINATEQLANAALTYAGGDDIVENFKAAFLKASASGATEDDKLELKRKLFVLVRMDIEMQTGPLADPAYYPYIFKSISANLKAVSLGLTGDDAGDRVEAMDLPSTDADRSRKQRLIDVRDRALALKADAEMVQKNVNEWAEKVQGAATSANDAATDIGDAVNGKVQANIKADQQKVAAAVAKGQSALDKVKAQVTGIVDKNKKNFVDAIRASEAGPAIAAISGYMPLLGPAISFGKAAVRLVSAIRAARAEPFRAARSTGTGVERARVNTRLGIFSSCRLLQMLQRQLEAQVLLTGANSRDETLANFGLLGLPPALVALMPEAAQLAVGRTMTATLCAVINPVHHRINAVFRNYSVCGGGPVSEPPYSSHNENVAAFLSHELSVADPAFAAASKRHAFMPHVETCNGKDLYDVVLTSAAQVDAWEAWGYKRVKMNGRSMHAEVAELNAKPKEETHMLFATGVYSYELKDAAKTPSRVLLTLSCEALKRQVASSATSAAAREYFSRLKVPLTDLRIVSRRRRGDGTPDVAGAEEEGLIASGLRPLLLAGAPLDAVKNANAFKLTGASAVFPPPTGTKNGAGEEVQPEAVQSADIRKGHTGDKKRSMFIYVARGGPAPLTEVAAFSFTQTVDIKAMGATWYKYDAKADDFKGAAIDAASPLGAKLAAVDADKAQRTTGGSLVSISEEVTYESLAARTGYLVKNLFAPYGCAIVSTPAWARYECPATGSCDAPPSPDEEEMQSDMSSFTRFKRFVRGIHTGKPHASEGMVVHDFTTACQANKSLSAKVAPTDLSERWKKGSIPPTNTWERVLPAYTDDGSDDVVDRVKQATSSYLWLERRYAGPALRARDPLQCAAVDEGATLPPARAVRHMTATQNCYMPRKK